MKRKSDHPTFPKRIRVPALLLGAVLSPLLLVLGCGEGDEGPQRFEVSGTVTFKGQPVPYGSIQFQPDSSKGNSGPTGYANILDGQYSTKLGGKGVISGPHQVIVTGHKSPPPEVGDPDKPVETSLFPQHMQLEDFQQGETTLDINVPATAKP